MNKLIDPNSSCFTRSELEDYSLGRIDELAALNIERHLRDCEICESTFVAMESAEDTFVEEIRLTPSLETDCDDDLALQETLRRSKNLLDEAMPLANTTDDPPQNQTRVGDYELCELIGHGGMGQVFRARHCRLEKEFALKVLSGRRLQSSEAVSRFQREMKIVGQLDHPTIVQATDAGQEQDVHYLTMEFVPGFNLSQVIRLQEPLKIADACEIVRQAAEGIDYAHRQNVIHRDIKPSNLMLTPKGQIKILDLGLATLSRFEHNVDELTTVGQMMGTLDYMAPEQCEELTVDHRCDIYSLGATLYKLVTGRAPYSGEHRQSPLQKLRAIAMEPFTPVSEHRPDLPELLVEIIHRSLSRDAADRFESAQQLSEALEPFCDKHNLIQLQQDVEKSSETERQRQQQVWDIKPEPTNHQDELAKPQLQQAAESTPPSLPRWPLALAVAALIPLVWFGIQIIVNWDNGQLIIESDTANVQVKLVKDGKPYKNISVQQGTTSTKIRAGKYEILIDDPSDKMLIDKDSFLLKRGNTTVAKITSKPNQKTSGANAVPPIGSGNSTNQSNGRPTIDDLPTYQGKSLDQWYRSTRSSQNYRQSAIAFGRTGNAEVISRWIREMLRECENEVSLKDLTMRIQFLSLVCPDKKVANDVMSFIEKVVKRYTFNEVLGQTGSTLAQMTKDLERFAFCVEPRMLTFMKSDDRALNAFALEWINRATLKKSSRERLQFRDELVNATNTKNQTMLGLAANAMCRHFGSDSKTQRRLLTIVPRLSDFLRQKACRTLATHDPMMSGLAQHVVDGVKNSYGREFTSYSSQVYLLAIQNNLEIAREIQQLLADTRWGWDSAERNPGGGLSAPAAGGGDAGIGGDFERKSSEPTVKKSWFGRYDPAFRSHKQEQTVTNRSRRSRFVESFGRKPQAKILLPVVKNELHTQYNDYYIDSVLRALVALEGVFTEDKFRRARIHFWLAHWMHANDDVASKRVADILWDRKTRPLDRTRAQYIDSETLLAFVQQLGNTQGEILRDVKYAKQAFPHYDFSHLNSQQAKRIERHCSLLFNSSRGIDDDVFKTVLKLCTDKELPALVWVCHFAKQRRKFKINPSEISIFAERAQKLDTIFTMRILSLQSNNSIWLDERHYSDPITPKSDQKEIELAIKVFKNRAMIRHKVLYGLSDSDKAVLKSGSADEIAIVLSKVSAMRRQVEPSVRSMDVSMNSHHIAELFRYLDKPRKELVAESATYRVNLWERESNSSLLEKTGTMSNLGRLVAILKNVRFVDSKFKNEKQGIIETLKNELKTETDPVIKVNLATVLEHVERADEIATYVRARAIEAGAKNFRKATGMFPAAVKYLMTIPENMDRKRWNGPHLRRLYSEKDQWDGDYHIEADEIKNKVVVVSAGKDKKFGTKDDIRSDQTKWRNLAR